MDIILVLLVVAGVAFFLYGGEQTVESIENPSNSKARDFVLGSSILVLLVLVSLLLASPFIVGNP